MNRATFLKALAALGLAPGTLAGREPKPLLTTDGVDVPVRPDQVDLVVNEERVRGVSNRAALWVNGKRVSGDVVSLSQSTESFALWDDVAAVPMLAGPTQTEVVLLLDPQGDPHPGRALQAVFYERDVAEFELRFPRSWGMGNRVVWDGVVRDLSISRQVGMPDEARFVVEVAGPVTVLDA